MVKKPKKPLPLPPGTYEASVTVLSPPLPSGSYEAVPTKFVITKGPFKGRSIFGVGERVLLNVLVLPFEEANDAL